MNNQLTNKTAGRVEMLLETLTEKVYRLNNLSNDVIDLIQRPQPCDPGCPCCEDADPTLMDRLFKIESSIDNAISKIETINEIINRNLGSIKLD
jgi:hypothetical protein